MSDNTDTLHAHQTIGIHAHLASAFEGAMAKSYNDRTGGCNITLANHLISLVSPHLPPPTQPLRILDNACGPAVLTTQCMLNKAITEHSEVHISAVDISKDFIEANRALIASHSDWTSNGKVVDTEVMNGMDLKFEDNSFDVSFTSLAIFAFPDPVKGAAELYRTLKPGGVAALTTWKRAGWLSLLHEVERILKPGSEPTQLPYLEEWSVPGKLEQTLRDGGFKDVVESDVLAYAWWPSMEEAANRMTETLRMMVGSGWTAGEKERMEEGILNVMKGGSEHMKRSEDGKVGFEGMSWTGLARK